MGREGRITGVDTASSVGSGFARFYRASITTVSSVNGTDGAHLGVVSGNEWEATGML